MLDRSGYRARIVSIISGGYQEDGQSVAFGMELPDVVEDLKARLRAGKVASEVVPTQPGVRRITVGGGGGGEGNTTGARFIRP